MLVVCSPEQVEANAGRGRLFTDMLSPHLPREAALRTLLTGRDLFQHETAPTLDALVAERGVETEAGAAPGRPFFLFREGAPVFDEAALTILVAPYRWRGVCLVGDGRSRVVEAPVRLLDVAPTVLDALGLIDLAIEYWLPGTSLLEHDGRTTYAESYLTDGATQGWRTRDRLLVGDRLCDLDGRPVDEPERAEELRRRMVGHVRRRRAETGLGL